MPNVSSSLLSSARMPTGQDRPDDGGGGAGPLHQVQRDLPQPAHPAGAGGPAQDLWSVTPNVTPVTVALHAVPTHAQY